MIKTLNNLKRILYISVSMFLFGYWASAQNPIISANGITTICASNSVLLNIAKDTLKNATYQWQMNGTNIPNATNNSYLVSQSGNYTVLASNGKKPNISNSIPVIVIPTPTISATGNNPTACATATGSITIYGLTNGNSYIIHYTDRNGVFQTLANQAQNGSLTINNLRAGTYSGISVVLNNCISNTIPSISLSDPNPPEIPIIASVNPTCSQKSLFLHITNPVASAIYSWNVQGEINGTGSVFSIPSINMYSNGIVSVTATLNSCTSTVGTTIIVVDSTPISPIVSSASPFCSGSPITLTASNVDKNQSSIIYQWTGPNSFSSNLQNPTISTSNTNNSGIYSVVAINNANGLACSSPAATTSVVVIPKPTITAIGNSPTVCATATGSITIHGLTNGNSYIIHYTDRNGVFQILANQAQNGSFTINNLRGGTYSEISVVLNNCISNTIPSISLSDPNPPITPTIVGKVKYCSGEALQLSVFAPDNNSIYTWSSGRFGEISSGNSLIIPSINTFEEGVYYVTANKNNCLSQSGTINIIVDSTPLTPIVTSPIFACKGSDIQLNASSPTLGIGSILYQWYGPNGFASNLQNPTITKATIANAGEYSVKAINNSCNSPIATTLLRVDSCPLPITLEYFKGGVVNTETLLEWKTGTEINTNHFIIQHSKDAVRFTEIGKLIAVGTGTNSYHFKDNTSNRGINYYRLNEVDRDGSITTSQVISVSYTPIDNSFTVYPNPAKDRITIAGNHVSVLKVLDNMGKMVANYHYRDATNPKVSVNDLAKGIYHLQILSTRGETINKVFIKE